ncbi:hypothetical protein JQK62_22220 [Leptospira santarosai]|nr:hypothetical protein [Leptospira santarosai]
MEWCKSSWRSSLVCSGETRPREATIIGLLVGLVVTFGVYATGNSFGIYEGFWELLANILALVLLNPIFAKKAQNKCNPIMDQLFTNRNEKGAAESIFSRSFLM